jgi:hypothetical protein
MKTKHIVQISVAFTHAEAEELKALAQQRGVNVSNFIRERLDLASVKMGARSGRSQSRAYKLPSP